FSLRSSLTGAVTLRRSFRFLARTEVRSVAGDRGKRGRDSTMNRRTFVGTLSIGLLAAPLAVDARPAGTPVKIGVLSSVSRETSLAAWTAFRQGLRELGWDEGRNIVVEMRLADGKLDRLSPLAQELLSLNVRLIVAQNTPAARAAI